MTANAQGHGTDVGGHLDLKGLDSIFVRDFIVDCSVGVYAEEQGVTQKVAFDIEAGLTPGVRSLRDEMAEVPSYADIIDIIEAIAASGHINLVETFAEKVAAKCLENPQIAIVSVALTKLERGPRRGIRIVRSRPRTGKS
jgi:dihydroneopterin aldolase